MKTLVLFSRLALMTSLLVVSRCVSPGPAHGAGIPAPDVPEATLRPATALTPPFKRYKKRNRVKRPANPAPGFGREYFRPRRTPSQRKPDSLPGRAQQWLDQVLSR